MEMQKEIEELKYDNLNLQRDVQTLNNQTKAAFEQNILAIQSKGQSTNEYQSMAMELQLLKEKFDRSENAKQSFYNDVMTNYGEINQKLLKSENEGLVRLRSQKQELLHESSQNKDQITKLEHVRMEKIMGDTEYTRSLIEGIDRKLKDETAKRISGEYENKLFLEGQVQQFRDEMKNDQRDILQNENKFIREIQETISN